MLRKAKQPKKTYERTKCETGVVQIHQSWGKRRTRANNYRKPERVQECSCVFFSGRRQGYSGSGNGELWWRHKHAKRTKYEKKTFVIRCHDIHKFATRTHTDEIRFLPSISSLHRHTANRMESIRAHICKSTYTQTAFVQPYRRTLHTPQHIIFVVGFIVGNWVIINV